MRGPTLRGDACDGCGDTEHELFEHPRARVDGRPVVLCRPCKRDAHLPDFLR